LVREKIEFRELMITLTKKKAFKAFTMSLFFRFAGDIFAATSMKSPWNVVNDVIDN
jgi:hypothetical protein